MAKLRGIEAKLQRLKDIRDQPITPGLLAELRSALGDPSSLMVAAAAEILGNREIKDLTAEMVQAFDRLMIEPEESDRNCVGKIALVRALNQLDFQEEATFLQGLDHYQNQIFQSDDDAGAALRGECAFGLARIAHPQFLEMMVDRLCDRAPMARRLAVQALGASGRVAAALLLRFKAKTGDKEPAVTAECLTALMALAPKESLDFVAKFLRHGQEEVQEGAIFALAESRQPEALKVLLGFWPRARRTEVEAALLLGISMLRQSSGIDFLLNVIRDEPASATAALTALAIHRHQAPLKARVAEAVEARKDRLLAALFLKKFGPEE